MSSHPVDIHVGKRLRFRRTMLGMSQEALGTGIGVTFQQIQKYERGINRMGASRLYDFSTLLNVPVSYFFEGIDKNGEYTDHLPMVSHAAESTDHDSAGDFVSSEKLNSRATLELIRAYYRITNASVRKRIIELMRSLADKQEDNNSDDVVY